jgi:cytochrome c peroxidase
MWKVIKIIFIILSGFIFSCNTNDGIESSNLLDQELEGLLLENSENQSLDYYKFPSENDLHKIPQDPKNPLNAAKIELGKLLFHETGIGQIPKVKAGFQTYSCASCHHVKAGFQACVPQGIGEGGVGFGIQGEKRNVDPNYKFNQIDVQPIRTPSTLNIAYQTNILWNGQFGASHLNKNTQRSWLKGTPRETNHLGFEGTETQAIAGMGVHRLLIDKIFITKFPIYRNLYLKAFDAESLDNPKQLNINAALAIAAYERTLLANKAPFQQWLSGNKNAMSEKEKKGAVLFFGKANCVSCHNGPSLAKMEFHALGMNDLQNGNYGDNIVANISDGQAEHKGRGGFTSNSADLFKFKVPQLYNLIDSPFYGHGASFGSILEILKYKNEAKPQNAKVNPEMISLGFKPLNLSDEELTQLEAFIKNGLYDKSLHRYVPAKLPSGLAFPNNDKKSRIDLGF